MARRHKAFRLDSERIGQTREIVEQPDHLHGVVDFRVGESGGTQPFDRGAGQAPGIEGDLDGEIGQGPLFRVELGLAVVALDLLGEFAVAR